MPHSRVANASWELSSHLRRIGSRRESHVAAGSLDEQRWVTPGWCTASETVDIVVQCSSDGTVSCRCRRTEN
eukprot:gene20232-14790_t